MTLPRPPLPDTYQPHAATPAQRVPALMPSIGNWDYFRSTGSPKGIAESNMIATVRAYAKQGSAERGLMAPMSSAGVDNKPHDVQLAHHVAVSNAAMGPDGSASQREGSLAASRTGMSDLAPETPLDAATDSMPDDVTLAALRQSVSVAAPATAAATAADAATISPQEEETLAALARYTSNVERNSTTEAPDVPSQEAETLTALEWLMSDKNAPVR